MKKILLPLLFLFFLSVKTHAQCDSLPVTCTQISQAMSQLSSYSTTGMTDTVSIPFAAAYLGLTYQNVNLDSAGWVSAMLCCDSGLAVNLNDSILSFCETAEYVRIYMQDALPGRSCLPNWLDQYLYNSILLSVPLLAGDTTLALFCNDLNTCGVKCLNICDDSIVSACDSINSVAYAYRHILQSNGETVDSSILETLYNIMYGNVLANPPSYATIMAQINNCNANDTAVFTSITYTDANLTYSTDSFGHYFADLDLMATDTPNNLLFSQVIYL